MSAPTQLSLAAMRAALRARTLSARELAQAHLAAMERQRALNAFITETPEGALAEADAADARLARGDGGALLGIPLAIKDLFCTRGVRTTAGSRMLERFVPPYESTVTLRLRQDGAVFLGKTNLDEFAMGSSTTSSAFGATANPWRRRGDAATVLVAGGSSGGSAAAVAARLAAGAMATDTGGSIRQPASYCGIVGVKPTYGRCSRWGIVAYASSLDQAGPMARTVEDAAILLTSIAGHDAKDSTSAPVEVPDFAAGLEKPLAGLRVGVPREYQRDGTPAAISALWQQGIAWLKDAGCTIHPISLPHTKYALPTYYIVAPAEASSNLARYDGVRFTMRSDGEDLDALYANTRADGFGAEVKRRILIGTYVLSAGYYDAYYLKAQQVRARIAADFTAAFRDVDVVLTPTTPSAAFAQGARMEDPVAMYLNDVFTVTANLAGLPGVSVPAGLDADGLPLGLQLIGRPFDEATMLQAARAIERAADFRAMPGLGA